MLGVSDSDFALNLQRLALYLKINIFVICLFLTIYQLVLALLFHNAVLPECKGDKIIVQYRRFLSSFIFAYVIGACLLLSDGNGREVLDGVKT